jgi:1,6-anhydro-N-acetylmuramate kinase
MPANDATRKRLIAGCMTGTSLDGLDAALAEITGTGLDIKARCVGMVSKPLGDLREELRHFASGGAAEPLRFLRAARHLGELHAEAVAELCEKHLPRGTTLDFVVAHGQTIWHAPDDPETRASSGSGVSWQLFDPWPMVRRLKVPVCYDLRQADLIAGGQGAPITPIADWVLFRDPNRTRQVINLGGVCNVTTLSIVGDAAVGGRDVGVCNILIDGVVRELFNGQPFDQDGTIAASGKVHAFASEYLRRDKLKRSEPAQGSDDIWIVSLGREQFTPQWIRGFIEAAPPQLSPADVVASAVAAAAEQIQLVRGVNILAGGGSRNRTLVQHLRERAACLQNTDVVTSEELGIPVDSREALCFAVLGALSQDNVPITLPQVTGAKSPGRAGAWVYP